MAKQVIVLRKDLNMRKGKMVAQGSHASMGAFFNACNMIKTKDSFEYRTKTEEGFDWLQHGFTKVCVSVDSEEELLEIFRQAKTAKLPAALITDSGRTEFGGVPTNTAVGIGPADESAIDAITGKLKLL